MCCGVHLKLTPKAMGHVLLAHCGPAARTLMKGSGGGLQAALRWPCHMLAMMQCPSLPLLNVLGLPAEAILKPITQL